MRLHHPAYRYVHALLSRTIVGHGDSMGAVTHLDLYMMYNMITHYPINLGYILVELVARYGQHPKLGTIFKVGPLVLHSYFILIVLVILWD